MNSRPWPLDAGILAQIANNDPRAVAVRAPNAETPPGYARFQTEANPPAGIEYVLADARGRFERCDVHISAATNWQTARATLRLYALTPSGRSLIVEEDAAALPLYQTSGKTNGRAFSAASSGATGWQVTVQAGGTGTLGRCVVTMECAPAAGSSGVIAAILGSVLGNADRAEHIRGAAGLALDTDGRWHALARVSALSRRAIRSALEVASLADPAPDYYEISAGSLSALAVPGRALRNATGAVVASVTIRGPGSIASRTLSNLQPGEIVPVQIASVEASSAWPLGILTRETP